jgi:hypothetical protein
MLKAILPGVSPGQQAMALFLLAGLPLAQAGGAERLLRLASIPYLRDFA